MVCNANKLVRKGKMRTRDLFLNGLADWKGISEKTTRRVN